MPKWPFGSQKVKVECATKLRTTCTSSCPTQWAKRCPPPTGHNSTTNTAQKLNPVPGRVQARPGTASLLASVYTLYTLARTLLVIPANKTFITIGYSGNVGHVGLLPTDRNANARDKQVEHFVRQRRPRLNQVASAVPLPVRPSVLPSVCLSQSGCLHMSAAACRSKPQRSSYVKTFWLARKVQIKKAPKPQPNMPW